LRYQFDTRRQGQQWSQRAILPRLLIFTASPSLPLNPRPGLAAHRNVSICKTKVRSLRCNSCPGEGRVSPLTCTIYPLHSLHQFTHRRPTLQSLLKDVGPGELTDSRLPTLHTSIRQQPSLTMSSSFPAQPSTGPTTSLPPIHSSVLGPSLTLQSYITNIKTALAGGRVDWRGFWTDKLEEAAQSVSSQNDSTAQTSHLTHEEGLHQLSLAAERLLSASGTRGAGLRS
jgi:hypothetical protein